MSRKNDYSKKIINILAKKRAVSLDSLISNASTSPLTPLRSTSEGGKKAKYAIVRSIKGLEDAGLIEKLESGQGGYARLTKDGKKKAHSIKLESESTLVNPNWDGKWRIILLDLPESRKNERESLRYLLKKAGFVCLKNSAWISPFPYEHMFANIKKDLGLTTEIMIFTTDTLDEETEKEFLNIQK